MVKLLTKLAKNVINLKMYNILIALLIIIIQTSDANQMKITKYTLTVSPDLTLLGEVARDGQKQNFKISLESEDGIILITPKIIANALGNKTRATQHQFSFAGPENVSIDLSFPDQYYLFSSFKIGSTPLLEGNVSQFVIGLAEKKSWNLNQFVFNGTTFELVSPKNSPQVSFKQWETSIKDIWIQFSKKFGSPTDHLVFVDLKGPISGGPLGENVLAIFAMDNMPKNIQEDMLANLGWEPLNSTREYVEKYYPQSLDRWNEYLIGTFAHEIAHLYFGFGITRQRIVNLEDLWFSLGLGMVYDMEVTKNITGNLPQLEVDLIDNWKNKIAIINDIDHKLVNPNTQNDHKYKFDRKKVFAHGKAAFFLNDLRSKMGPEKFDLTVMRYLNECKLCENGYHDFKKYLESESKIVSELEKLHGVF